MSDKDQKQDATLEGLFAQARAMPPVVPDALMARIMADAETVQPRPAKTTLWALFNRFGGFPAVGGLVTATCVGFWIGVAPPAGVPDLAAEVFGLETAAIDDEFYPIAMTGFGWDIEEEL